MVDHDSGQPAPGHTRTESPMNQPRDANGCFSRRATPKESSGSGADGSYSLVRASLSKGFTERQGPVGEQVPNVKPLQYGLGSRQVLRYHSRGAAIIGTILSGLGPPTVPGYSGSSQTVEEKYALYDGTEALRDVNNAILRDKDPV